MHFEVKYPTAYLTAAALQLQNIYLLLFALLFVEGLKDAQLENIN